MAYYTWEQYQSFCKSKGVTPNFDKYKAKFGSNTSNTNKPRKKHSGCRTWSSNGTNGLNGWNYSKERGMISFIASPKFEGAKILGPRRVKEYTTKDGGGGKLYLVKITFKRTLETKLFTGFMANSSKVLTIPDIGMCANPRAKNGGYFGTFTNKK